MTDIATLPATCDGRSRGAAATEWGFTSLPCNTTQGLTTWTDESGVSHRACYHHLAGLRSRYPERYRSEVDGDGLAAAKAERDRVRFMDPREREIVIESNDGYEVTVDEDDEWTNREGMPEFNGSFR